MKPLLLLLLLLLMAGCGDAARPLDPGSAPADGVAATLDNIGSTLTWIGSIATASGCALALVSLVVPVLAPIAALFRFVAIAGLGITGTGISTLWLSDHLWLLILGILASLGAVVWWYWPGLARAWRRRVAAPRPPPYDHA